jgi:hypothetical protein
MLNGDDFLRAQVQAGVMQHHALVSVLRVHAAHGQEAPFRMLCARHLPMVERHQRMFESYASSIGVAPSSAMQEVVGAVLDKARDVVAAFRDSDYARLVATMGMLRQSQDTFAAFARAGAQVDERGLADLGRACGAGHDVMQREFVTYAATVFVAHLRAHTAAPASRRPDAQLTGGRRLPDASAGTVPVRRWG